MLEIMVALVVVSIGLVALYSLQVLAIDGNITAQEITQATAVGERWTETLRRDAITWTDSTTMPPALRRHGVWQDATSEMVNKDFVSRHDDEDVLDPRFCVKYRVDTVPPATPDPRMLRVDVRVVWPRRERALKDYLSCPPTMMEPSHLKNTWQVTIPTLLYRHRGDA